MSYISVVQDFRRHIPVKMYYDIVAAKTTNQGTMSAQLKDNDAQAR